MIKFALGKSIPTSITVVDTKIKIFLFRKFCKIFSFSSFSNDPCMRPTLPGNLLLINLNLSFAEE